MHRPLMIKISLKEIIKLLFYLNGLEVTVCEDCAVSQDNRLTVEQHFREIIILLMLFTADTLKYSCC